MVQPRPIRVALDAHVAGRRGTGNETYVVNLADALANRADVEALVYVDAKVAWPGSPSVLLHRLTVRTPFLRIPVELPFRARRDKADLLHVQYVSPPVSGLPLVTTIHDLSFEDIPGLFRRPTQVRLRWFVRQSARRSAAVITISEFTRSRLLHHYDLDPSRVFVTPLAVSPRWHRPSPQEQARRLQPIGVLPPFVLAVGNLHPRKNIPRLIRSIAAARDAGAGDLHLVVAGSRGWRSSEVDAAVGAVGGQRWVRFLGYVEDDLLQALYSEARVVAYPSIYEGFGLPVLEALACGGVVVASNATAIPEAAGSAAVLVDASDERQLTEGLIRAATDEALRAQLIAAGPPHAARFTWDRVAAGTVEAYRAALNW